MRVFDSFTEQWQMRVRRRAYLHRSSDVSSASRSVQEANRLQSGRRERPTAAVASQAHRGSQRRKRTVAQVRCQGWQWRLDDLLGYAKPSTVESLLSMVESLLRLMVESWLLTELAAHTPAALVHLAAPRTSLAISLARHPLEIAESPQIFSAARVGLGS